MCASAVSDLGFIPCLYANSATDAKIARSTASRETLVQTRRARSLDAYGFFLLFGVVRDRTLIGPWRTVCRGR